MTLTIVLLLRIGLIQEISLYSFLFFSFLPCIILVVKIFSWAGYLKKLMVVLKERSFSLPYSTYYFYFYSWKLAFTTTTITATNVVKWHRSLKPFSSVPTSRISL